MKQARDNVAKVGTQVFDSMLPVRCVLGMNQSVMLELLDYICRLLKASVQQKEPLVQC